MGNGGFAIDRNQIFYQREPRILGNGNDGSFRKIIGLIRVDSIRSLDIGEIAVVARRIYSSTYHKRRLTADSQVPDIPYSGSWVIGTLRRCSRDKGISRWK